MGLSLERKVRVSFTTGRLTLSMQPARNPVATYYGGAFLLATLVMGIVVFVFTLRHDDPTRLTMLLIASVAVVPLQALVLWMWLWPTLGREVVTRADEWLRVDCRLFGVTWKHRYFSAEETADMRLANKEVRLALVLSGPPVASRGIVFGKDESAVAIGAGLSADDAEYAMELLTRALPGAQASPLAKAG